MRNYIKFHGWEGRTVKYLIYFSPMLAGFKTKNTKLKTFMVPWGWNLSWRSFNWRLWTPVKSLNKYWMDCHVPFVINCNQKWKHAKLRCQTCFFLFLLWKQGGSCLQLHDRCTRGGQQNVPHLLLKHLTLGGGTLSTSTQVTVTFKK